jgi:hypothetical protein
MMPRDVGLTETQEPRGVVVEDVALLLFRMLRRSAIAKVWFISSSSVVGDQIGSAHAGFLNFARNRSPYGVAGSHAGYSAKADNRLALLRGERDHQSGTRGTGGKGSHRGAVYANGVKA